MHPAILPALATAASAGLSWWTGRRAEKGVEQQNQAAAAEAQRNRDFQAQMSNTAVQRSVADYEAAGLNPALAYGHSASSPSGAVAPVGNPLEAGLSNARQTHQAIQEFRERSQRLKINQQDADIRRDIAGYQAREYDARNQVDVQHLSNLRWDERMKEQEWHFRQAAQPQDLRIRAADAALRELELPGKQNRADLHRIIGALSGSSTGAADINRFRRGFDDGSYNDQLHRMAERMAAWEPFKDHPFSPFNKKAGPAGFPRTSPFHDYKRDK